MALIAAVVAVVLAQFMVGVFSRPIDFPASAYVELPVSAVVVGLLASHRAPPGGRRRSGQGVRG